jgi:hypothetical protein
VSASACRPSQTTSVKTTITITALCALWTAIPIHALRYRFVGYASTNESASGERKSERADAARERRIKDEVIA